MGERQYESKEEARMVLVSALEQYKNAAEVFESSDDEMADEIEQALQDSGFAHLKITDA